MKLRLGLLFKIAGALLLLLLIAGFVAPVFTADQYGRRLQASLERALGRRVEIGNVHFNLFKGPGFSVDNVTIYEDPSIGMEPVVYIQEPGSMEVAPSIWSLLGGKFVIASIRLDGASINLTKSGPASEWGRWNFSSIVNPSVMRTAPAIHVRDSRIHFKFGDTKSVFYLTETDLDISPSGSGGDWKIACSGQPARADRPAQGLGSFTLKGRWYADPGRVDLDLEVDRAALGEITALMSGQDAGVHGTLTSRLHLAGPLNNMGITGRLDITDVHRWDMMPGNSQGWRQQILGRLDLIGQQIELHSTTRGQCDPAADRAFPRHRLSFAAALGRRPELESLSRGPHHGTGAPHGRAVSAQAATHRHHGWRHRLHRAGKPARRAGLSRHRAGDSRFAPRALRAGPHHSGKRTRPPFAHRGAGR